MNSYVNTELNYAAIFFRCGAGERTFFLCRPKNQASPVLPTTRPTKPPQRTLYEMTLQSEKTFCATLIHRRMRRSETKRPCCTWTISPRTLARFCTLFCTLCLCMSLFGETSKLETKYTLLIIICGHANVIELVEQRSTTRQRPVRKL